MADPFKPSYNTGFARNAAESAYPELWRGLVGLWSPSLGATGKLLHDWSGRGDDDGTFVNMDFSDWVSSERGLVLSVDGVNESIEKLSPSFVSDTSGSISIWIKKTANSRADPFFYIGDSGTNFNLFRLAYSTANDDYQILNKGAAFDNYRATYNQGDSTGIWQHVVFTVDSTGNKFYVDGELVTLVYTNGNAADTEWLNDLANVDKLWLGGGHLATPGYFDGLIGNVSLYNRALTHNEVSAMFTGASPTILRPPLLELRVGATGTMELSDGTSHVSFAPLIDPGIRRPDNRTRGVHQYDGGPRQYWDVGGARRDDFALNDVSKADADILNGWWQAASILEFRADFNAAPATFTYSRLNPAGGRPFQYMWGQTVDTKHEATVTIVEVSSSSSG